MDFSNIDNLLLAIDLISHTRDYQSIYDLNALDTVSSKSLQDITIQEPTIVHKLLKDGFYDNDIALDNHRYMETIKFFVQFGEKFPSKRDYHLRLLIKKCLIPKAFKYTLDNYRLIPQSVKKYFIKHLKPSDNEYMIATMDYNELLFYIRNAKPVLNWSKLIKRISDNKFYQIISITNNMRCYQTINMSYTEFKKEFTIPKTYEGIIQTYLDDYIKNSPLKTEFGSTFDEMGYNGTQFRWNSISSGPMTVMHSTDAPTALIHTTI
jgi:hypothetical protein